MRAGRGRRVLGIDKLPTLTETSAEPKVKTGGSAGMPVYRPLWGLREPVSSGTHFVALIWSIYATLLLWRLCRGEKAKQISLGIFGLSMIVLYAASSSYHAVLLTPDHLRIFQLLDHSAIYCLIAGTYTPALLVLLHPSWPKRLLIGGIWLLAVVGIACKWLLPGTPYWVTLLLYFGLGYSGVLPILEFKRNVGYRGLAWAFGGGLCYTLGGVVDLVEWPSFVPGIFGHHELFHLFSMAGTGCHFSFMMLYVVPFAGHPEGFPAETSLGPEANLL
jgi:hemolysin III